MYTKDDYIAIFNITCAVLGIGSLGMAHAWAKAGPLYGSISLGVMCLFNVYSAVCLSKCLLHAPSHVKTYSDLGEHVMGTFGRYLVLVTQFGLCLMAPIAFLVLGGSTLLPGIFNVSIDANVWIFIMAVALLPVVLIRNLKEAAWAALLGAAGAFFCIVVAMVYTLSKADFEYHSTKVNFKNVIGVFGANALAYGGAVVIPAIQREHDNPKKVPGLMAWSLIVITVIYAAIAILGYAQFGCSAPSNLLLAMPKGFAQITAYVLMEVHIAIALAVMLNPVLYVIERNLIGDSSAQAGQGSSQFNYQEEKGVSQMEAEKRTEHLDIEGRLSRYSMVSVTVAPYTKKERMQSYLLRTSILGVLVFVSMLLQGSFSALGDFIGATAITMSCMVVPCLFYLKMLGKKLPLWEQILCWVIIVCSTLCGLYAAYSAVRDIIDTIADTQLFRSATGQTLNKYMYCYSDYSKAPNV